MRKLFLLLVLCGCVQQKPHQELLPKKIELYYQKETKLKSNKYSSEIIASTFNFFSEGTCFLIKHKERKYLVTAKHVVNGRSKIVTSYDILLGKSHYTGIDLVFFEIETNEKCLQLDKNYDLPFIDVTGFDPDKVKPLSCTMYGYSNNKFHKVSGKIWYKFKFNGDYYIFTGESIQGMSGSPVIHNEKVIGMHIGSVNDRAYLIPSYIIVKELEKLYQTQN